MGCTYTTTMQCNQVPPQDVQSYLIREGWIIKSIISGLTLYYHTAYAGDFTWEQALLYTAFKKMNLG